MAKDFLQMSAEDMSKSIEKADKEKKGGFLSKLFGRRQTEETETEPEGENVEMSEAERLEKEAEERREKQQEQLRKINEAIKSGERGIKKAAEETKREAKEAEKRLKKAKKVYEKARKEREGKEAETDTQLPEGETRTEKELSLEEIFQDDALKHTFKYFLKKKVNPDLSERWLNEKTKEGDQEKLEEARKQFEKIHHRVEKVRKAIKKPLMGGKSYEGAMKGTELEKKLSSETILDLAIEESAELKAIQKQFEEREKKKGEKEKREEGQVRAVDTKRELRLAILDNLELVAIDDEGLIRVLEREIKDIEEQTEEFKETDQEIRRLCGQYKIPAEDIGKALSIEDLEERKAAIRTAIEKKHGILNRIPKKKEASLYEDLDKRREEILEITREIEESKKAIVSALNLTRKSATVDKIISDLLLGEEGVKALEEKELAAETEEDKFEKMNLDKLKEYALEDPDIKIEDQFTQEERENKELFRDKLRSLVAEIRKKREQESAGQLDLISDVIKNKDVGGLLKFAAVHDLKIDPRGDPDDPEILRERILAAAKEKIEGGEEIEAEEEIEYKITQDKIDKLKETFRGKDKEVDELVKGIEEAVQKKWLSPEKANQILGKIQERREGVVNEIEAEIEEDAPSEKDESLGAVEDKVKALFKEEHLIPEHEFGETVEEMEEYIEKHDLGEYIEAIRYNPIKREYEDTPEEVREKIRRAESRRAQELLDQEEAEEGREGEGYEYGRNMEELEQYIIDNRLDEVDIAEGETEEDVRRKIRKAEDEIAARLYKEFEEEEKARQELTDRINRDPQFVINFLYTYIENRFRGNDAMINGARAKIDALDNDERREYALKLV